MTDSPKHTIQLDSEGEVALSEDTIARYFNETRVTGNISEVVSLETLNKHGLKPTEVILNPEEFREEHIHPELIDEGESRRVAFARHIMEMEGAGVTTRKELIHEFDTPEKIADGETLDDHGLSLQEVFSADKLNRIGNMWVETYCHPDREMIAIAPADGYAPDRFKLKSSYNGTATFQSDELARQDFMPEIISRHNVLY